MPTIARPRTFDERSAGSRALRPDRMTPPPPISGTVWLIQ